MDANNFKKPIRKNLAEKLDRRIAERMDKVSNFSLNSNDLSSIQYRAGYRQKFGSFQLASRSLGKFARFGRGGGGVVGP